MPEVIDADAQAWLDPYDIVAWYASLGDECLSHTTLGQRWVDTRGAIVFCKQLPIATQ